MKIIISHKTLNSMLAMIIVMVGLGSIGFSTQSGKAAPVLQDGPVYIVQQGDTLNDIALRFGIQPEELLSVNNLDDPNALFIGQQLVIPGLEGITGTLTSRVLTFGTSLTQLTRQFDLNPEDLVRLNRITSPTEAIAGVRLIVPTIEGQDQQNPVVRTKSGETALEAAIRSNTSPWILAETNQLTSPWDIIPGETLFGSGEDENNVEVLPGIAALSIDALPLIQGETLQINLSSDVPVEVQGRINGDTFNFFEDGEGQYYGLYGIYARAQTGAYPLQIVIQYPDGQQVTFEQLVYLADGGYGNEWVFVGEDYLDDDIIDEENNLMRSLFDRETSVRYWDGRFQSPVDQVCVDSPFGARRNYNDGELMWYHTGIDYGWRCVTSLNIYAPAAGEVIFTDELNICGMAVLIDHGWGVFSRYCHMSEFTVDTGDLVQPGDLLGLIGNTGRSTGPHLHFEILIDGTPVNPQTWLNRTFP